MFGLFEVIVGLVKTWVSGRQEKQKAKQHAELAAINNNARLLADTQSNNHAWEMANLLDKDKWLRRISFVMFAAPFIVAIGAPNHVANYFENAISTVPMWWQKTYMGITGSIWGISALKNSILSIVGDLRK